MKTFYATVQFFKQDEKKKNLVMENNNKPG